MGPTAPGGDRNPQRQRAPTLDGCKGSGELQYALEKQAGEDFAHNHAEHVKRMRKLLEAGAFRVLLPPRRLNMVAAASPVFVIVPVPPYIGMTTYLSN